MGLYDTVGHNRIQIKCTSNVGLAHYELGDPILLADGLYFGYEGWFVVRRSVIVADGSLDVVRNKWGGHLPIDINPFNPITPAIAKIKGGIDAEEKEEKEEG